MNYTNHKQEPCPTSLLSNIMSSSMDPRWTSLPRLYSSLIFQRQPNGVAFERMIQHPDPEVRVSQGSQQIRSDCIWAAANYNDEICLYLNRESFRT